MVSRKSDRRHTILTGAGRLEDFKQRANAEIGRDAELFDTTISIIRSALDSGSFTLRPSLILSLHGVALDGISTSAGAYRVQGVVIQGSPHAPPEAVHVPELVEAMCSYVNENWERQTALHLAAYIMWRLNWIQPFSDGNGRVARALSYIALSIRLGVVLPGSLTIPQQIAESRSDYFKALDDADAAWSQGRLDVSSLEALLERYLARQLLNFYERNPKVQD